MAVVRGKTSDISTAGSYAPGQTGSAATRDRVAAAGYGDDETEYPSVMDSMDVPYGWDPPIDEDGVVIEPFEVGSFGSAMSSFQDGGRSVGTGRYLRMKVDGRLWMSDTSAERYDHYAAVSAVAENRGCTVMIAGLGLGMVANAALKQGASHVHIVEKDPRVARVVGEQLKAIWGDDKVTIEVADWYDRKPKKGETYGVVWQDVWPDLNTDYLERQTDDEGNVTRPSMGDLSRRWSRRSEHFNGIWGKEFLDDRKRRDKANDAIWNF